MLDVWQPTYRYVLTDFLTGALLAEVPFRDVSYSRVLRRAGDFSGTIAFVPETAHLNLYNNTMPAKTCIYVMRDDVCMWGGIIWNRSYDSKNKTLTVDAAEMVSYLYHRYVWQTLVYTSTPTGIVNYAVTAGVGVVQTTDKHGFLVGDPVDIKYTGSVIDGRRIIASVDPTGYQFTFSIATTDIATTTAPSTSYCKYFLDTYDVARHLLATMSNDFEGLKFENDAVTPYITTRYSVSTVAVSGGVMTVTLDANSSNLDLIVGQTVSGRQLLGSPDDDGTYRVLSVATDRRSFTAATTHADLVSTAKPAYRRLEVYSKKMDIISPTADPIVSTGTIVTKTAHGLAVGDIVEIEIFDGFFDGVHTVASVVNTTTFTFTRYGTIFASIPDTVVDGTRYVVAGSYVNAGTYGSFTLQSVPDGFDVNTLADSGLSQDSQMLRGYELKSIGDFLETYSNNLNGFEYRIDSSYNNSTGKFDNIFTFIERILPNPPSAGNVSPISRFGVQDLIFEYPGNIESFTIEESAENSATRMWVVGNQDGLSGSASQPYAAETNTEYLDLGWPLLDQMETESSVATQSKLSGLAAEYLIESRPPIGNIKISVNGSLEPSLGSFAPGDWIALVFTDQFMKERLASTEELRSNVLVRKIVSYTVDVPNVAAFPEMIDIELIEDWQVDKRGD